MPVQHCTNRGIPPLVQSFPFLQIYMMIMIIIRNPVYAVLKQSIYNLLYLLTGSVFLKYPLHNLCRFRLFDQLIDSIYLLTTITIRSCCSDFRNLQIYHQQSACLQKVIQNFLWLCFHACPETGKTFQRNQTQHADCFYRRRKNICTSPVHTGYVYKTEKSNGN